MAYIRTALAHESPIIFIQIEQDGKISKETFLSVYPGACGMFFHHKKNDYAITLTNGRFSPPPEGWRGTVFYPLHCKKFRNFRKNFPLYIKDQSLRLKGNFNPLY